MSESRTQIDAPCGNTQGALTARLLPSLSRRGFPGSLGFRHLELDSKCKERPVAPGELQEATLFQRSAWSWAAPQQEPSENTYAQDGLLQKTEHWQQPGGSHTTLPRDHDSNVPDVFAQPPGHPVMDSASPPTAMV
ncbi:hypothetical protein MUG91_G6n185 [Manis pentadactyla]|nr:hypothetical protein MUG91_G6n185 [Manis pentadactyla]